MKCTPGKRNIFRPKVYPASDNLGDNLGDHFKHVEVRESHWKFIITGLIDWKKCSSKTLVLNAISLPRGKVLDSCHRELATANMFNRSNNRTLLLLEKRKRAHLFRADWTEVS
jgi:hypothetical protein